MADDYTVTGQRQTTIIGPNGQLIQVREVTFQTTAGVIGHVDVPLNVYSADTVKSMIEADVSTINAVANL